MPTYREALRVRYKTWLAKHKLIVEFCRDCGKDQPLVWWCEDELWLRLMKTPNGIACPECFDRRARQDGLLLIWRPMIEGDSKEGINDRR